jgi:hypothetical protein
LPHLPHPLEWHGHQRAEGEKTGMKRVMVLVWAMGSLGAVDIDPPSVPNPYNVSESRALRDHLADTYHITASDKTSLDNLRAIYRKAWNKEQMELLLDEKPADHRFVQAYREERKAELAEQVQELGGTVTETDTPEALTARIAELRREAARHIATKQEREAAEARAHVIAALEADHATTSQSTNRTGTRGEPDTADRITLNPVKSGLDLLADDRMAAAMVTDQVDELTTRFERASYAHQAADFIQQRLELGKQGYEPQFSNVDGIEVWSRIVQDHQDPEKLTIELELVNPTAYFIRIEAVEFAFSGTRRNPPSATEIDPAIPIGPRRIHHLSSKVYYQDPDQVTTVAGVKLIRSQKGWTTSRADGAEAAGQADRERNPR